MSLVFFALLLLVCGFASSQEIVFTQPEDGDLTCGSQFQLTWSYADETTDFKAGDKIVIELVRDGVTSNPVITTLATVPYEDKSWNWNIPSPLPGWRSKMAGDGKEETHIFFRLKKFEDDSISNDVRVWQFWPSFTFSCCPDGDILCACLPGNECSLQKSVCQDNFCVERIGVSGQLGEFCRPLVPRCDNDYVCANSRCSLAPKAGELDGPCRLLAPVCDNNGDCVNAICRPPLAPGIAGNIKFKQPGNIKCGDQVQLTWEYERPQAWASNDLVKIALWYDATGSKNQPVDTIDIVNANPPQYTWQVPSPIPEGWSKIFGQSASAYLRLSKLDDELANNDPSIFWSSFNIECVPPQEGEAGGVCRSTAPQCDIDANCQNGKCISKFDKPPPSTSTDSGVIIFYQPTGPWTCGQTYRVAWDYDQPELWRDGDRVNIELWYDAQLTLNNRLATLGQVLFQDKEFVWDVPDPMPVAWEHALEGHDLVFIRLTKAGNEASNNDPRFSETWDSFSLQCCPSGTRGCPCLGTGACISPTDICSSGTCLPPPAGAATGVCRDEAPRCDGALACDSGICGPQVGCTPGTLNCGCKDNGVCDGDLIQCVSDICLRATSSSILGMTCAETNDEANVCLRQESPPLVCQAGRCATCQPRSPGCSCDPADRSCDDPARFRCNEVERCVPIPRTSDDDTPNQCPVATLGCACNGQQCAEPLQCVSGFCRQVDANSPSGSFAARPTLTFVFLLLACLLLV